MFTVTTPYFFDKTWLKRRNKPHNHSLTYLLSWNMKGHLCLHSKDVEIPYETSKSQASTNHIVFWWESGKNTSTRPWAQPLRLSLLRGLLTHTHMLWQHVRWKIRTTYLKIIGTTLMLTLGRKQNTYSINECFY